VYYVYVVLSGYARSTGLNCDWETRIVAIKYTVRFVKSAVNKSSYWHAATWSTVTAHPW